MKLDRVAQTIIKAIEEIVKGEPYKRGYIIPRPGGMADRILS